MTLQGPHQVAKASRTTTLLSLMAESNSVLLFLVSIDSDFDTKAANVLCEIVDTHIDSS